MTETLSRADVIRLMKDPSTSARAETAAKGKLLFGRQLLLAKYDHLMLEESRVNFIERLIAELCREIDTDDFGAKRAGQRLHFNIVVGHLIFDRNKTINRILN